jgi:hypothetical protein
LFNNITKQNPKDCDPPCFTCDDLHQWGQYLDKFHYDYRRGDYDDYQSCCGREYSAAPYKCPDPEPCPKCPTYNPPKCDYYDDDCCRGYNCSGYVANDASVASAGESTNSTVATLSWVLIAVAAALFLASIAFCAIGRRERKAFIASSEQSQSAMA